MEEAAQPRRPRRILVCGDRNWRNAASIVLALHEAGPISTLIEGGSTGADAIAREWAECHPEVEHVRVDADWERHGKAAGPTRNVIMLRVHKPDLVLAFHKDLHRSKGTRDMVIRALKDGVRTKIFER